MRGVGVGVVLLFVVLVGRDVCATQVPVEQTSLGPQPHPQLTPLGYQLSARKEHALATRRHAVKAQRSSELAARLSEARTSGDAALVQRLEAVLKRVEVGPPNTLSSNAWGSEHVAHMQAANQWRKYGAQLDKPEVVEEFDKHALRVAKLRRMRAVVQAGVASSERETLLADIDTTIEMEATRHVEQLERWLTPKEGTAR